MMNLLKLVSTVLLVLTALGTMINPVLACKNDPNCLNEKICVDREYAASGSKSPSDPDEKSAIDLSANNFKANHSNAASSIRATQNIKLTKSEAEMVAASMSYK